MFYKAFRVYIANKYTFHPPTTSSSFFFLVLVLPPSRALFSYADIRVVYRIKFLSTGATSCCEVSINNKRLIRRRRKELCNRKITKPRSRAPTEWHACREKTAGRTHKVKGRLQTEQKEQATIKRNIFWCLPHIQ